MKKTTGVLLALLLVAGGAIAAELLSNKNKKVNVHSFMSSNDIDFDFGQMEPGTTANSNTFDIVNNHPTQDRTVSLKFVETTNNGTIYQLTGATETSPGVWDFPTMVIATSTSTPVSLNLAINEASPSGTALEGKLEVRRI